MCTQQEIAAYAEKMQRVVEEAGDEFSKHWKQVREQPFDQPRESWTRVAEWYREYEDETGTMLGCD